MNGNVKLELAACGGSRGEWAQHFSNASCSYLEHISCIVCNSVDELMSIFFKIIDEIKRKPVVIRILARLAAGIPIRPRYIRIVSAHGTLVEAYITSHYPTVMLGSHLQRRRHKAVEFRRVAGGVVGAGNSLYRNIEKIEQ